MDETKSKPNSHFIQSFLKDNKKILIIFVIILIIIILSYFLLDYFKQKKNIKISEKYNILQIQILKNQKIKNKEVLLEIINEKNKFYSPMALNLILEKKIDISKNEIIKLFDIILSISQMSESDKDLFKIKKAMYLSRSSEINEDEILKLLNPIINSDSVWRIKAITFLEKYYITNNEIEKSKEFSNLLKN